LALKNLSLDRFLAIDRFLASSDLNIVSHLVLSNVSFKLFSRDHLRNRAHLHVRQAMQENGETDAAVKMIQAQSRID
jgi:hypothetical protein